MILVNISVGKPLATEFAGVGFILAVYNLVSTHLIQPLERLITDVAIIGSLFCEK